MASIVNRPNGRREIQFVSADGSRKTLRLGKCDQKTAQAIRTQIELLAAAQATGTGIPRQTAEWLKTIEGTLRDRIAATGLIEARQTRQLGDFITQYLASRIDAAESTQVKWRITAGHLTAHLGEKKLVHSITSGDAQEFRLYLTGRGLAENTIRSNIAVAKMLFNGAKRWKLVESNPFAGQKATTLANQSRFRFISRQDTQRLLEAAPDWQWRLIIGLTRYGGLRCPSEVQLLRWSDIDWARQRITVTSPKTEHSGKESRQVPLFPELQQLLSDGFEMAEEGDEYVVSRYRTAGQNLRTGLSRIIRRAGLTPWPKLFQNLRSTRETELVETYPIHVVTGWLGNTASVAQKHYLQTTEEHFEKATQNPTQQASAGPGNASLFASPILNRTAETPEKAEFTGVSSYPAGTRIASENAGETSRFPKGDAESDASDVRTGAAWQQVRALISTCPDLPVKVRQKLVSLGDHEAQRRGGKAVG